MDISLIQKRLSTKSSAHYISAIVLGMNDALVELTAALAGFTIALHDNRLIILAGITTGVAATLSMAAAEFLSKEADDTRTNSYWAAMATGAAYLLTVGILLAPYFIIQTPFLALAVSLVLAGCVIFLFTFIMAKIRKTSFLNSFFRMLTISVCVAAIAFLISWGANTLWDV